MATALREILAKFGFEVDSAKLDEAKKGTDDLAKTIKSIAGLFAGAAFIGGIKSFVGELTESASQIKRTSQQLGLGTHELQRWQTAASMAGVDADALAMGIKFLQKNASEAAEKGGDAAAVFKKLSVNVKDAAGNVKPTGDLLRETGLAIGGIQNPAQRTAEVLKVFGRQGLALIPMFNKGAEGLDELLGELDRLGGGISDEAIAKLSATKKAGKQLDLSLLSLKSALAAKIVPAVTVVINVLTRGVGWFTKATQGTEILTAGFIAVTAAVVALNAPMIATAAKAVLAWLPLIATVVLTALVFDDLLTAMKGGKSVIGDVVEYFGGRKEWLKPPSSDDWDLFFQTLASDLNNWLTETSNAEPDLSPRWKDYIISYAYRIGEAFSDAYASVKSGLNNIGTAIKEAISEFIETMATGASDMVSKFVDGIAGGVTKTRNAIKGLFSGDSGNNNVTVAKSGAIGSIFQSDVPTSASIPYVPSTGSVNKSGNNTSNVTQHNTINVPITTTGDPSQVAGAARQGINGALDDSRRGMLHALEPVAPGSP